METPFYGAVEADCTGGLIMEVFDDLDKVSTDVLLLHGCPQSCLPNPVEDFLEVYEDMVEVLLVLKIFFTKDSQVEDLLCGAPSCSKACLFFSNYLVRSRLQSVQNDLQHDFAWVADKFDR